MQAIFSSVRVQFAGTLVARLTRYVLLAGWALLAVWPAAAVAQSLVTAGEFQVTDAGAAAYTLPIYTAPAAGNVDVKLALQYNSQGGNGVLGVGWSLTGVSSITRCPKTPAEEGVRAGVKYDTVDVFCLDGQKLHLVAGAYGAAGSEYRTARDSYSRIVANGQAYWGPQSFTVYTKSGSIIEFGGTADSRLGAGPVDTVWVWMVSQIRDRFSTTANTNSTAINFSYSKDMNLGEQLLREVRYNNGLVRLNYEARPANDPIIKFDGGVQLGSTNSRVSKIEIFDEPVVGTMRQLRLFKEYRLAYTSSSATRRSLLTGIKECGPTGLCLPQTVLGYQNTNTVSFVAGGALVGTGLIAPGAINALGDFQGKGKQSVKTYSGLEYPFGFNPFARKRVIAWDIDGDGITDEGYVAIPDDGNFSYNVVSSGGITAPHPLGAPIPMCYGDSTGRGLSSVFQNSGPVHISEGSVRYYLVINGNQTAASIGDVDYCQIIDVDGDGSADLYFPQGVGVVKVTPTNTAENVPGMGLPRDIGTGPCVIGNGAYCYFRTVVGDFNGDGRTDMLAVDHSFNFLRINFSNSANSLTPLRWVSLGGDHFAYSPQIACTGDFNGDGRTDLFGFSSAQPTLFLSNGNSFTEVGATFTNAAPYNSIICGDFNGDGITDVAVNGLPYLISSAGMPDLLSQINNGLGHVHSVEYKSITDDNIYTKGAGAIYPMVDLQTPLQVVARGQSGNALQGWNATSYRYEALRADLLRRGTLGFAKVTSRNETTNISVDSTYSQYYPFIGLKTSTVKSVGAQTLSVAYYLYDQRGLAGAGSAATAQYAQVPLTAIHETRWELGTGAFVGWSQEYFEQIDPYGNIGLHSQRQLDGAGAHTSRKTTNHSYTVDTSRWLVGQLSASSTRSENLSSLPATAVGSAASAGIQSGNPPLRLSASPNPASGQRANPGTVSVVVTGQASGGSNVYNYQWTKLTGTRLQISSPTQASTSFTANLTWGENVSETAKLQVTDSLGAVTSTTVTLTVSTPPVFNVAIAPIVVSGWRANPGVLTASTLITSSGGTGGYTYSWRKVSGTRIAIANPNTANPSFSAAMAWAENFTETARVVVTDAANNTVVRDVSINFSTPQALSLSASATQLSGWRANPGVVTASTLVTASGGTGGYTYSWSKVSGTRIAIANPNTTNPGFSVSLGWGENLVEWVRLTATDSAGNSTSLDVSISFSTPAQLVALIAGPSSIFTGCNHSGVDTFTATVSGGVLPYQYAWQASGGLGVVSQTANSSVIGTVGNGVVISGVLVTVQDAVGNMVQASSTVFISVCDTF